MIRLSAILLCSISLLVSSACAAPSASKAKTKIGFIGSLTNFAANYGKAVLEGVQMAVDEANISGDNIELLIEDDQSVTKHTVSAFKKMTSTNDIKGIIGGSWWINSIVKLTEQKKIPLLSVETCYDKDSVTADTYFIMPGDLRNWVYAFEPIIEKENLKSAAIIQFTSGFGQTLTEALKEEFSKKDRKFLGAIEYSEIDPPDVSSIVLKLKTMKPDLVFIDAQPGSFVTFVKKMQELGLNDQIVFSYMNARDAYEQELVDDLDLFRNVFYVDRDSLSEEFNKRFIARYNRPAYLNADLGYYSTKLLLKSLKSNDPITALRSNSISIDQASFKFDNKNVLTSLHHSIWSFNDEGAIKVTN